MTEDALGAIKAKVLEKAQEKVNELSENARQVLQYQLKIVTTEMIMGDTEFYNQQKASDADKAFVANGGGEVFLIDAEEEDGVIAKTLRIELPDGVSSNIREAVALAFANTKKMIH